MTTARGAPERALILAPPGRDAEIAAHPYVRNPFPSLWDEDWISDFTQNED